MTTSDQIACGLSPPSLCGVIAPYVVGSGNRLAEIDIGFACKVPFSKLKTKTNPLN